MQHVTAKSKLDVHLYKPRDPTSERVSTFSRHEPFELSNTNFKSGMERFGEKNIEKLRLENRPKDEQDYVDALIPKVTRNRIPERETIPAKLGKDSAYWQLQHPPVPHINLDKTRSH